MTTTDRPTTEQVVPESPASAALVPEQAAAPVDTGGDTNGDGAVTGAVTRPVPPVDGRIRASNDEREQTVAMLHAAVGEGRLTLDEADERITAVYGVRYRDELSPFLADLPSDGRRRPDGDVPDWRSIWDSIVWRVLTLLHGHPVQAPTAAQSRTGVIAVVLAVLWFGVFAAIGAGLVR